jgi:hypothetical protein
MNQWHSFTPDTIGEAERMRDAGASFADIGRAFGTTNTAARLAFIRFGLRIEPWPRCSLHNSNGYLHASLPGGREEFVHRLVAEVMLGRRLRRGEIVHHRDENKRNNQPGNLEVLPSHSVHAREHQPNVAGQACTFCGAPAWGRRLGVALCRRCHAHQRRYHEQGAGCSMSKGRCPFVQAAAA